jgi:hypothetical protein
MNAHFWRGSEGPGNRWNTSYKNSQDGMIVICGVTHDLVQLPTGFHQTQYALALEQALTHEFLLERRDERCSNESFSSGNTGIEETKAIGVVYFVFKFSSL